MEWKLRKIILQNHQDLVFYQSNKTSFRLFAINISKPLVERSKKSKFQTGKNISLKLYIFYPPPPPPTENNDRKLWRTQKGNRVFCLFKVWCGYNGNPGQQYIFQKHLLELMWFIIQNM